jgi:hypothetical protein
MMQQDWHVPRSGERCGACQREFAVNELFQAYIDEAGEGFARRDYCLDCAPANAGTAVGSWRTRRAAPSPKKNPPIDREALYGFFQALGTPEEPQKRQFRFVLALLLWRQRVLKLVDTATDESGEVWSFVEPKSGDSHAVPRPDLDDTEIERLSAQLEQLIAGEGAGAFAGMTAAEGDAAAQ